MEDTYIKMENLKNGYCYKILVRNAYVGVWITQMKAFMISRYKMGDYYYLFYEYHWDTNDAILFLMEQLSQWQGFKIEGWLMTINAE